MGKKIHPSKRIPKIKHPSVLALPGMKTACELYRIISPFSHMTEMGYDTKWGIIKNVMDLNIMKYDVIVLPRIGFTETELVKGVVSALHQEGKTVVFDTDDDLLNMDESNPSKAGLKDIRWISDMVEHSDAVTVTNEHLRKQMLQYNKNVVVLPNCIDPDLWVYPHGRMSCRIPETQALTIGVYGGSSHYEDWKILADVFPIIHKRHPEVKFVVAGYHPNYLCEDKLDGTLININWVPLEYYQGLVAQIDISLCPIIDTLFNRSKSAIKWMESSMSGAPVIASPLIYGEHIQHGKTGFLATSVDEWVSYIEMLIKDEKLRRKMNYDAKQYVLKNLNIHNLAGKWMDVYDSIYRGSLT